MRLSWFIKNQPLREKQIVLQLSRKNKIKRKAE